MAKKKQNKSIIQELMERRDTLLSKRLAAHRSGASYQIMAQIDRMLEETELDLYTENELARARQQSDNEDGEAWIV